MQCVNINKIIIFILRLIYKKFNTNIFNNPFKFSKLKLILRYKELVK